MELGPEPVTLTWLQLLSKLISFLFTKRLMDGWASKRFYLNLAVQAVKEVNKQRDASGMTYARKAMIKCGLSKDAVSGQWKEEQLF